MGTKWALSIWATTEGGRIKRKPRGDRTGEKPVFRHTAITWRVINQVTIGCFFFFPSSLEKYMFRHALNSPLLSARLWKQCFISYGENRPGHSFVSTRSNRMLSLWAKGVAWVVGRWGLGSSTISKVTILRELRITAGQLPRKRSIRWGVKAISLITCHLKRK